MKGGKVCLSYVLVTFIFIYKFYFKKEIKLKKDHVIKIKGTTVYYDMGYLHVYHPENKKLKCKKTHGSNDFIHRDFRIKYENNFFYLYLDFTKYKIELVWFKEVLLKNLFFYLKNQKNNYNLWNLLF